MYSYNFRSLCTDLLEEGRNRLSLTMGIVSHIEKEDYEIVAVSSNAGVFVAGESFALKDTYCRDVYKQKKTIAITEIDGHPGLQHHPLYMALALEAYIGSPIFVDGQVWGTLNFSCMQIRDKPFTDEEIQFNENATKIISRAIIDKI